MKDATFTGCLNDRDEYGSGPGGTVLTFVVRAKCTYNLNWWYPRYRGFVIRGDTTGPHVEHPLHYMSHVEHT